MLGCGSQPTKLITMNGSHAYEHPTMLDINAAVTPDVVFDLGSGASLPFDDDAFDEAHAYDSLEHFGRQGDWRFFFRQFDDFWRVLKPGGMFMGICPKPGSPWAWGDPGHTRVIAPESLTYLCRPMYGTPPMTDYRAWYRGDFDLIHTSEPTEHQHAFVLQAVKPAR